MHRSTPPLPSTWVAGPAHRSEPRVVVAAARAGALGLLTTTGDRATLLADLALVAGRAPRSRVGLLSRPGAALGPDDAPEVDHVVLAAGTAPDQAALTAEIARWRPRWVAVEVTSAAAAEIARAAGADAVVLKGEEAGGRVGTTSAFVLTQQVLGRPGWDLPTWVRGGIGRHTAAAVLAAGAAGVVLDDQLALTREAGLPADLAAAVRAMDGSETVVVGGHRLYTRPDLPVAALAADDDGARPGRGRRPPRVGPPLGPRGPRAGRGHGARPRRAPRHGGRGGAGRRVVGRRRARRRRDRTAPSPPGDRWPTPSGCGCPSPRGR